VPFIVIECDPKTTVFGKKLVKHSQSRPHHGAPFVMAQAVINADRVRLQPFPDHGCIDVIVVAPAFIAGVVRRVDKDAVYLARIEGQQRLQGVQVVTMDNHVAVKGDRADAFVFMGRERAEGHRQMVIIDKLFALKTQLRHSCPFLLPSLIARDHSSSGCGSCGFPVYRSTLISPSRLRAWAMS